MAGEKSTVAYDQSEGLVTLDRNRLHGNLWMPLRIKQVQINYAEDQEQCPPPDRRVQFRKHHRWRRPKLVQARTQNQYSVNRQKQTDEEPNGYGMFVVRHDRLPEDNVQDHKHHGYDAGPEDWPLIQRVLPFRWQFRAAVDQ